MRAAVTGSPIAHSKSPLLHRAAYAALGLDWQYDRFEVPQGGMAGFVAAHRTQLRGISITMPGKEEAHDLADIRSVEAELTGRCNTLLFDDELRGFNTDVQGFSEALRYRNVAVPEHVTIIGTGATARSALVALAHGGATHCDIVARSVESFGRFAAWAEVLDVHLLHRSFAVGPRDGAGLVISTTPAGATDALPVPAAPGLLFDVVYAPWPTGYATAWMTAGGRVLGGLELLIHQAAEQVLLMTGVDRSQRDRIVEAMYAAVAAEGRASAE